MIYSYFNDLYRKLNIKNTMAVQYHRIREINASIETNDFSISYARIAIEEREKSLRECKLQLNKYMSQGVVLSHQIEEAEISHMRTE